MNKKLYIFAVDGVLVDNKHLIDQVIEGTPDEDLTCFTTCTGVEMADALELPEGDESRALLNRVYQLGRSKFKAMCGAVTVLQTTKPKCVVSSDAKIMARVSLLKAGLIGFFDDSQIFTMSLFPAAQKVPFSELLKCAARSMDFPPEQCVFVTDEVAGVRSAYEAGMQSIGFIGGSHILSASIENEMKEAGASYVITNMSSFSNVAEAA